MTDLYTEKEAIVKLFRNSFKKAQNGMLCLRNERKIVIKIPKQARHMKMIYDVVMIAYLITWHEENGGIFTLTRCTMIKLNNK